ncbi:MAG: hypothetical protein ED557_03915 [Balneola sp.]|nr:MAG: hypothetical protein ED557_03915 [Balneola sp.]
MDAIKGYLIDFISSNGNAQKFEKWLYEQDSSFLENYFGENGYLNLIGYDYRKKTFEDVVELIKTNINPEVKIEFDKEFEKRKKMISGVCVKNIAPDYDGKSLRNWGIEIGEVYSIINIWKKRDSIFKKRVYVEYVNPQYHFFPSGLVPMELFEINLTNIPDPYLKSSYRFGEYKIEPKAWSKEFYLPINKSFWDDFYNHDDKAVDTYHDTLKELGIITPW